jgi:hypothetical protein
MVIEFILYTIALGMTLYKVYYDISVVGFFTYNIILPLVPDLLIVLTFLISFKSSCLKVCRYSSVISVVYFYFVLGFNGKGSAMVACSTTGLCDTTVNIICSNLTTNGNIGILYLLGTGIKITTSTLMTRAIYIKSSSKAIVPRDNKLDKK